MNKEDFKFTKGLLEVTPNGVKEACLIAKEYLDNKDNLSQSAVTEEEFIKASKILLNYSFTNSTKNTVVEEFYCKEDCRSKDCFGFCQGEFSLGQDSKILCKNYKGPND